MALLHFHVTWWEGNAPAKNQWHPGRTVPAPAAKAAAAGKAAALARALTRTHHMPRRCGTWPKGLKVFVLHPGITPLGNDPEWFKITRFSPEMCLNGVNTQWVYAQGVIQKPLENGGEPRACLGCDSKSMCQNRTVTLSCSKCPRTTFSTAKNKAMFCRLRGCKARMVLCVIEKDIVPGTPQFGPRPVHVAHVRFALNESLQSVTACFLFGRF